MGLFTATAWRSAHAELSGSSNVARRRPAILIAEFADAVVGRGLHRRTGLFLIIDWLQQRNVRALPWWGSAYLIGASAMAMGTMPEPLIKLPAAVPGALTFL